MEENNKKMQFEDVYSDSTKEKEKPAYKRGHKPLDQREICYPNKFVEFLLKNNKRNTKIILIAMIILPECTYANDCTVVDLKPEEYFEIVL